MHLGASKVALIGVAISPWRYPTAGCWGHGRCPRLGAVPLAEGAWDLHLESVTLWPLEIRVRCERPSLRDRSPYRRWSMYDVVIDMGNAAQGEGVRPWR